MIIHELFGPRGGVAFRARKYDAASILRVGKSGFAKESEKLIITSDRLLHRHDHVFSPFFVWQHPFVKSDICGQLKKDRI